MSCSAVLQRQPWIILVLTFLVLVDEIPNTDMNKLEDGTPCNVCCSRVNSVYPSFWYRRGM